VTPESLQRGSWDYMFW